MLKKLVKPIVVGAIAALLVLIDSLIASFFIAGVHFTWIGFIYWTVFSGKNIKERLYALLGSLTGFCCANLMVMTGQLLNKGFFGGNKILLGSMLGVCLINIFIILYEDVKKAFFGSVTAIFVAISISFSGAGVKLPTNDVRLLLVIIVYGAVGLTCGFIVQFLYKKIDAQSVRRFSN